MIFSRHACIALVAILLGALVSSATAAPLKYNPKPKEKFVYKVKVIAELPNRTETCTGAISYEPMSTSDQGIKLKYRGGLRKSTKYKGGRGPGHPGFPHHFPRGPRMLHGNSYGGLTTTSSQLLMTKQGKILSLTGNSQLPYLLGNLAMIPFEQLPSTEKSSWTNDEGTSVTENNDSTPFGPPRPSFPGHFNNDKQLAASEKTSFKLQGKKHDVYLFQKTYRLQCSDDKESIDMNGTGAWVFNEKLGMPEQSDFKYNIQIKEEGVTVDIPVTVEYRRLDGRELADYEKEEVKKAAEVKKRREQFLAEQKAPLSDNELRKLLDDLKSGDSHRQMMAITKLQMKKDLNANPEVIKAVQELLKSDDEIVRTLVQQVATQLTPELRKSSELNEAYASFMSLEEEEMGPRLQKHTPLPPGLLVAFKDRRNWKAARILKPFGTDNYVVEKPGLSRSKETVHWSNIRLAPPEVEQTFVDKKKLKELYAAHTISVPQVPSTTTTTPATSPFKPTKTTAAERSWRTWTDDSGTYKVEAKYLRIEGNTVFLKQKKDGKELKVPLDRLSTPDREIAKRLHENPLSDNPFE